MKAVFDNVHASSANHRYSAKGMVHSIEAIVRTRTGMENPVTARFYMGASRTASTVYCNVWIGGRGVAFSGSARAGGYGYCKKSQALADALADAGVKLVSTKSNTYPDRPTRKRGEALHFGGCGMQAARDAVEAVVRALGYRGEILMLG